MYLALGGQSVRGGAISSSVTLQIDMTRFGTRDAERLLPMKLFCSLFGSLSCMRLYYPASRGNFSPPLPCLLPRVFHPDSPCPCFQMHRVRVDKCKYRPTRGVRKEGGHVCHVLILEEPAWRRREVDLVEIGGVCIRVGKAGLGVYPPAAVRMTSLSTP